MTLLNTPFTVWDAMGFAAVFAMLAVLSVGGKKYAGRLDVWILKRKTEQIRGDVSAPFLFNEGWSFLS